MHNALLSCMAHTCASSRFQPGYFYPTSTPVSAMREVRGLRNSCLLLRHAYPGLACSVSVRRAAALPRPPSCPGTGSGGRGVEMWRCIHAVSMDPGAW